MAAPERATGMVVLGIDGETNKRQAGRRRGHDMYREKEDRSA